MTRTRITGLAMVVWALALGAGCSTSTTSTASGSSTSTTTTTSVAPATSGPATTAPATTAGPPVGPGEVLIKDYAFNPGDRTITAGETVTWTNQDEFAHYVISEDKTLDSGPLTTGQTYAKTFTTAGTYTYYCNIHNVMKATITVQ